VAPPSAPLALTGIKPSGEPHVGNLLGALQPALRLAETFRTLYFIADYHALTKLHDGRQLRELTDVIAATWLAFGLDPERTLLYRQSDVPQIPELAWILSCFTPKGLLDRAHAYKDASARRQETTAGVFTYPVLMAADILAFSANFVPVGRDQKQHVEICRDLALHFNRAYGDILTVPQPLIQAEVQTIPGTDGRKMSKSYGNVLPLFAAPAALRKLIMRIPTDSTPVEAPKEPDGALPFQLYAHFALPSERDALAARLRQGGVGWAEVKQALADALERTLAEPRRRYQDWLGDRGRLHATLARGGEQARSLAEGLMREVRKAAGVR
jgi:tryptophanyl-tRNA synthetase